MIQSWSETGCPCLLCLQLHHFPAVGPLEKLLQLYLSYLWPHKIFFFKYLIFLELFPVHSKTRGKVQRVPIHLLPPHTFSILCY